MRVARPRSGWLGMIFSRGTTTTRRRRSKDRMKNLFSVNKAADLLERDRATLVRALRHVKGDSHERGQPRYRMRTITDALAAQEARNNVSTHAGADRLRSRLGEIA